MSRSGLMSFAIASVISLGEWTLCILICVHVQPLVTAVG
jgi:hypothetical protein